MGVAGEGRGDVPNRQSGGAAADASPRVIGDRAVEQDVSRGLCRPTSLAGGGRGTPFRVEVCSGAEAITIGEEAEDLNLRG